MWTATKRRLEIKKRHVCQDASIILYWSRLQSSKTSASVQMMIIQYQLRLEIAYFKLTTLIHYKIPLYSTQWSTAVQIQNYVITIVWDMVVNLRHNTIAGHDSRSYKTHAVPPASEFIAPHIWNSEIHFFFILFKLLIVDNQNTTEIC